MAPDERCAAHGLWICTACGDVRQALLAALASPTPNARDCGGGGTCRARPVPCVRHGGPLEHAPEETGLTLAEMVERLRHLFPSGPVGSPLAHLLIGALAEIDRRLMAIERTDETVWRELYEATNDGRWGDVERLRGELRARGRVADERSAVVPGHDAPCSLFVRYPGGDGCGRCGFVKAVHRG